MIVPRGDGIARSNADNTIRGLYGGQMFDATGAPKSALAAVPPSALIVFSGAILYRSAVQSIPASTWTKITWDVEDEDTAAFHTGSSGDIVIPSAAYNAKYEALAAGFWAINGTGQRGMRITLNGGVVVDSIVPASLLAGGQGHPPLPTYAMDLVATDAIALEVYQSTLNALNFGVAGSKRSCLQLKMVGS